MVAPIRTNVALGCIASHMAQLRHKDVAHCVGDIEGINVVALGTQYRDRAVCTFWTRSPPKTATRVVGLICDGPGPCGARMYDFVFDLQVATRNSIMSRGGARK